MKKYDTLKILAYIYVLLPFTIFLLGWTKFFLIGLPLSVAILICLIKLIKETKGYSTKILDINPGEKILYTLIILVLICTWVYCSGVGGYSYQNSDHEWRNEIFKILVDYKWPVTKDIIGGKRGLSYYIGFWMIPALFGKLFGLNAGFLMQYIWAVIGISLTYQFVCRRMNKVLLWPLLIFILFSGLDIVGWIIDGNQVFHMGMSIDGWKPGYQYSSMTTQLFWVFNQAIYGWLITLMVISEESNKRMILLLGTGILFAIFPMIGLCPIIMVKMITNTNEHKAKLETSFLREFFMTSITYENVIGLLSFVIIMFLFLGNALQMLSKEAIIVFGSIIIAMIVITFLGYIVIRKKAVCDTLKHKLEYVRNCKAMRCLQCILLFAIWGIIVNNISSIGNERVANNNFYTYIEFLVIEIGAYIVLCADEIKKDSLYKVSVIVLMVCPAIVIGSSMDFCMRASIPAFILIYLSVINSLRCPNINNKVRIKKSLLLLVIILGAVTAISEIYRAYQKREDKTMDYVESQGIFEEQNFSVDATDNIFYQYLAAGQNCFFKHYNTIVYSNWDEFESEGYYFDGQYAISTEADPHIIFYCPEQAYQVELDIQWNSNPERRDEDGTEYSNAQIFWADESGNFSEDNSKWIRLNYGRDSYVVDIDCPPNTLYRVDVGEGENVQFDVYGIMFKTVSEYTIRERLICIFEMIIMTAIVIVAGVFGGLKNKKYE